MKTSIVAKLSIVYKKTYGKTSIFVELYSHRAAIIKKKISIRLRPMTLEQLRITKLGNSISLFLFKHPRY